MITSISIRAGGGVAAARSLTSHSCGSLKRKNPLSTATITAAPYINQRTRGHASQSSSVSYSQKHSLQDTQTRSIPKTDSLSQGHAADPMNHHHSDPQSQSVEAGKGTKESGKGGDLDAAAADGSSGSGREQGKKQMKPEDVGSGNKEGIGMVDQVGSAGGSAKHFEEKGKR